MQKYYVFSIDTAKESIQGAYETDGERDLVFRTFMKFLEPQEPDFLIGTLHAYNRDDAIVKVSLGNVEEYTQKV